MSQTFYNQPCLPPYSSSIASAANNAIHMQTYKQLRNYFNITNECDVERNSWTHILFNSHIE